MKSAISIDFNQYNSLESGNYLCIAKDEIFIVNNEYNSFMFYGLMNISTKKKDNFISYEFTYKLKQHLLLQ